ncbi:myelin-associated glycoprotein-like [Nelusetta ayraudi]|uniref:myelin-associated glycoprotein-like n=1 Tax=Nelusetta ayraudi TaxID=303726 RepID=UPI003F6F0912
MLVATSLLSVLFVSDVWSECDKNAHLIITTPRTVQGLSGSCLEIPCSFTPQLSEQFVGKRSTGGVWIKKDSRFAHNQDNVVFNSSKETNAYPMKFTGDLNERNCTTLFSNLTSAYSNAYFFRVESKAFTATASCHHLKIIVQDSPPSPKIDVSGVLREKESVNVTCTAVVPCPRFPPRLRWNLQDSQNQTLRNVDRVLETQILTTIRLTDRSDGVNVTCVASYPVNSTFAYATQAKTLDVSYAPKNTTVSVTPDGSLPAGSWVTLNCSSAAKPPISKFTWFRTSQGGGGAKTKVSEGRVFSFNLTDEGVYRCEAKNDYGTDSSEIRLAFQEQEKTSSSAGGIVAGIIVVILLLGGVGATLWLKSRHAMSSQLRQRQSAAQGSSGTVETEDVLYSQVDFSKRRPEKTSSQAPNSREQQCTHYEREPVYAQVKINK